MCHERVGVCWYGALVSSLGFRAPFCKDGFGLLIGCHGLSGLGILFFLVHALLFFEVEAVVVLGMLHFLLLLKELELFGHWVEVVNVSDGAMEEAIVVLGFGR
jgi:hypothetical protein